MFKVLAISLAVLFPMQANSAPPNQPSALETYKFIAEKVNIKYVEPPDSSGTVVDVIAELQTMDDPCVIKYTISQYRNNSLWQTRVQQGSLGNFNPTTTKNWSIRNSPHARLLYGYGNPGAIVQIQTYKNILAANHTLTTVDSKDKRSDSATEQFIIQFLTSSLEDGQRASKALAHLISKCGGRNELF